MQDLKFRKKRRGARRKRKKKGLSFEKIGRKLQFEGELPKVSKKKVRSALIWIVEIGLVCLFAFALVCFFGKKVSNAGESMKPVMKNGDVVLVDRLVYNARKPKRGEVVAFKPNGNENAHYSIKRIVGLPGETVQIQDGSIYIDGEKVTEYIHAEKIEEAGVAAEPILLGEDEYFVIGDNHTGSDDSRMADIGNVKRSDIYGKAWFVITSGENFGFVKR